MNKHRVFEIVCVVFLVVFIFLMSNEGSYSVKTAQEVADTVTKTMNVEELSLVSKNKIKKEFGIDLAEADSYVYYASDSIMTVDELFILKLKEDVKADGITEKIEKRIKDKQVLFEGYAPEQSALLKAYILKYDSGFIFYAVGKDASEAFDAFKSSIR